MKLSNVERLILLNQYKILSTVNAENDFTAEIEALEYGYEIEYENLNGLISEGGALDEPTCEFVLEIMDLYSHIYYSFDGLVPSQYKFNGFDGNNETRLMSYARYQVFTKNLFVNLGEGLTKWNAFNSHMPSVEKYQRMLDKWNSLDRPFEITQDHLDIIFS